ncbi:MAG TPA: hypothetical protein DIT64_13295 [Verrucomicrobiales bacterium]|nr:hypothetical protein [Verrucomicrobiales bacterium]
MANPRAFFQTHFHGLLAALAVAAVYSTLAVLRHSEALIWDEGRYLDCARNMTRGFYATDDNPDFVNGPGYPIVLLPFVLAGAEGLLPARLLNAFFMAGAAWFAWLLLRHYAGAAWAAAGAWLTGFHPTLLWMGFAIMTEPLAMFCMAGFAWSFCAAVRGGGRGMMLTAAFLLGWLTLTRVFFGHVIMAAALPCLALLPFWKSWRHVLARTLVILGGAFLLCTPWLVHTWQKTGRVLCWSTNSGELLYWMTSHHEGENGHWFTTEDAVAHPQLAPNHKDFYERVMRMPILQRDAFLMEAAMANLRADPARVAYNWACNLSRMAFGFPRSFLPEELRTVVLIAVNGPVIALASLLGLVGLWRWRSVPPEVWLLAVFAAIYLGGGSVAPALPRYFALMLPVLMLGIATVWSRNVRLSLMKSAG